MIDFYRVLFPLLGLLLGALPGGARGEFIDVLDLPASNSALAERAPLNDVAHSGEGLVAVGQRGHILYSGVSGELWQQARVPVSSDLTAVYFPCRRAGWAVGHDGVILHSDDAGVSWNKQLDGRQIGALMQQHYAALAAAEPASEEWATRLAEAQRMVEEGADKALLDVWFANDQLGYAVGVFGLILRTEDGGRHWQPFGERTDNPQGLHLNAISAVDGVPYIAGEQGLLLRWDEAQQRFTSLQTPYSGSFFGVIGQGRELLVYGLRGHVWRSTDGGANWSALDSGLQSSITAALLDGAGRYHLFSQAGHALRSTADGSALELLPQSDLAPVTGAGFASDQDLVLVGSRGMRTQRLP
ncbi:WD40/YVTN/BNR-like repeat-containing protein [Pseudomonas sp. Gutcm_11s]|uniref:WD40/YVTN/BNR-like repeat-containing protein n=1 Tax=Pseudomonas sp. Gutcm_11s TaxID=3026088 RepID=UPI00236297F6|nr:YCF48-related protein [Pseudomonas sp. Gutcm_11s]MDD0843929.1 YCF48-related protein [Pseudomonas sp. Gutcm_11s]